MVVHKMKQIVGFDSTNMTESQSMCKYSIINMINKKVFDLIITSEEKNLQYLVQKDVFSGRYSVIMNT